MKQLAVWQVKSNVSYAMHVQQGGVCCLRMLLSTATDKNGNLSIDLFALLALLQRLNNDSSQTLCQVCMALAWLRPSEAVPVVVAHPLHPEQLYGAQMASVE